MADDILKIFAEGRIDAKSLSGFMSEPANSMIYRRLAPPTNTLNFYLNRFDSINSTYTASVAIVESAVVAADALIATNASNATNAVNAAIKDVAIDANLVTDALIVTTGGLTQFEINNGVIEVDNLSNIQNMANGARVFVKGGYLTEGGYFIWKADADRRQHNGLTKISPTVPNVSMQSPNNALNTYASEFSRQVYLFRSGFGESSPTVTGMWIAEKDITKPELKYKKYVLGYNHLPGGNTAFFGRRAKSHGGYLYSLVKGAYGTTREYSYVSIYKIDTHRAPILISWFQVGETGEDYRELEVVGNYLYLIPFSGSDKHVYIVNIADKNNPVFVKKAPLPSGRTAGSFLIIGDVWFCHTWGGAALYSFNIKDPLNPKYVNTMQPLGNDDGSGSTIVMDSRGIIWGVLYSKISGNKCLVRYDVTPEGLILSSETFAIAGIDNVRRVFIKNDRLFIGYFNGKGMFEVSIDDPHNPVLVKRHDIAAGDLIPFGDSVVGAANSSLGQLSLFNIKEGSNEEFILLDEPAALVENYQRGLVAYTGNGGLALKLVFFDYGYDGSVYADDSTRLMQKGAYYNVGRSEGKLLKWGYDEGDARFDIKGNEKFLVVKEGMPLLDINYDGSKSYIASPLFIHNTWGSYSSNRGYKTEWVLVTMPPISTTGVPVLEFDLTGVLVSTLSLEIMAIRDGGVRGASVNNVYATVVNGDVTSVDESKIIKTTASFEAISFSMLLVGSKLTLRVSSTSMELTSVIFNIRVSGNYLSVKSL